MKRRTFLITAVGSGGSLAIAGCLGDEADDAGDGDDSAADTGTDDSADTDDEEPTDVEALIEAADNNLQVAVDELDEAVEEANDPVSSDSQAIETRPITARLDEASVDLETARGEATDEQLRRIEALEGAVECFRALVKAFGALGHAFDEYDTGDQYFDMDRFEDAIDAFERAEDRTIEAKAHVSDAREAFDRIDPDAMDDIDHTDLTELAVAIDEVEEVIVAMEYLSVGIRELAAAMKSFETANQALDAGQFEEAAAAYSDSSNQFYVAFTTFQEAESEVSAGFRADMIDMSCLAEALSDATDHFAKGAEAFADGRDQDGSDHFDDGEAALERCDDPME